MSAPDVIAVWFDIDGTMLHTKQAGRMAFSEALEAVFGWADDLRHVRFAGNTDLGIMADIMVLRGASYTEQQLADFYEVMARQLFLHLETSGATLYPGVRELLESLADYEHVRTGLVTGNIQRCAHIKVRHFGLHGYFSHGGFGDEHPDRVILAGLARQRLQETLNGRPIARSFLIGDTPSDIEAAQKTGMTSIAVATGIYDEETLYKAGADVVLPDLSDLPGVLRILGL